MCTHYTHHTKMYIYTQKYTFTHTYTQTDSDMHICTPHTRIFTYVYIQTYHKHTIPMNVYIYRAGHVSCVCMCMYVWSHLLAPLHTAHVQT